MLYNSQLSTISISFLPPPTNARYRDGHHARFCDYYFQYIAVVVRLYPPSVLSGGLDLVRIVDLLNIAITKARPLMGGL